MKYVMASDGYNKAFEADTLEEAREKIREWLRNGSYSEIESTIWVDGYLTPLDDDGFEIEDDREHITVAINPKEPNCNEGNSHDWQSPEWLGGCKENPGVWSHGGGVIIVEVCMHCGCERITDTWAQRPDTGEQALESVKYESNKYENEITLEKDLKSETHDLF